MDLSVLIAFLNIFANLCGTLQKGLFGTPPASGVTELTHLGPFF